MSLMILSLAMAIGLQNETIPVKIVDGGFCAGLGWVRADSPEGLTEDLGPDFVVFRYKSGDSEWGIYSGGHSQVSNGARKRLLKQGDVTVSAMTIDGRPAGYLAEHKRGGQSHFFGTPFKTEASARAFFSRVDFGAEADAKCRQKL